MENKTKYPAEIFRWMITSLQTVPLFYGTIPVKELYKVFQSGKDQFPGRNGCPGVGDISEKEYCEMLRGILSIANLPGVAGTPGLAAAGITCKFDGDELVPLNADDLVKAVRAEKKKFPVADYRILTYDEVMQVLTKGYVESPETNALESYLKKSWKKNDEEAVEIVRHLVLGFLTSEDTPQDAINELNHILGANTAKKAVTPDELMKMINAVIQVYQVSAMMDRCGWSPAQLYEKTYGQKPPKSIKAVRNNPGDSPIDIIPQGVKVVPARSSVATYLKANEDELKKRGIEVCCDENISKYRDTRLTPEGITQRARTKKVYPNDPCPCGSGKKFKNCHGK